MQQRSRLLACAGALTLATSLAVAAATGAQAAPLTVGSCTGQVLLVRYSPVLTDQTQTGVRETASLARPLHRTQRIAGTCTDVARTNDPQIVQPSGPLTPEGMSLSLLGNASCTITPDAQGADATAAEQWPMYGRLNYVMNQIYVDPVTHFTHRYRIQSAIAVTGNEAAQPDVVDVSGIVLTGAAVRPSLSPGAVVSGSLWVDPVAATGGLTGYGTGYEVDLNAAAACADAQPGNASIAFALAGGGGTSATSLLGSTAAGITFSLGE